MAQEAEGNQDPSKTGDGGEGSTENEGGKAPEAGAEEQRDSYTREEMERVRREAKNLRDRTKKAEEEAEKLRNASLSEQERKEKEAEKAKADAATATLRADRYEAAAAAGLDLKWASRLTGSNAEELKADAEKLAEEVGGGESRPGFDGGARTPAPADKSPDDLIREMAGRTPSRT